jgi:DNA-directed RNA polymerase specialized sigma24 family protein
VDFKIANRYAEQVSQGGDDKLRQQLTAMCYPHLFRLRKKLGFYGISEKEIMQELAADAVSDAIMVKGKRNLPFSICLHNTFRDRCRQRMKSIREQYVGDIMEICDISSPGFMIGVGARPYSAPDQAQNNELLKLAHKAINKHDRFSKKVIFQKMKGSTYPEMAEIFDETVNECKRVYWHDMNHIRKQIGQNYEN